MERVGTIEEAYKVFTKIPEFDQYLSIDEMRQRVIEGSIVLISEYEGELIGFKIGYPLNKTDFYSWLGGVVPSKRKLGVAKRMLVLQESLAAKQSFTSILVKSMNRFRSMLHMLIENGYDITSVENYGGTDSERICFRKALLSV